MLTDALCSNTSHPPSQDREQRTWSTREAGQGLRADRQTGAERDREGERGRERKAGRDRQGETGRERQAGRDRQGE